MHRHLDLVEPGPTQDELIVGRQNDVTSPDELFQAKWAGTRTNRVPRAASDRLSTCPQRTRAHQVSGDWRARDAAPKCLVRLDERAFPGDQDGHGIWGGHALDGVERRVAEERDVRTRADLRRKRDVFTRKGNAVVPAGIRSDLPGGLQRPSGSTFQRPFSALGTASASLGCNRPALSIAARPTCINSSIVESPAPPAPVAPQAVLTEARSATGCGDAATTRFSGVAFAGCAISLSWSGTSRAPDSRGAPSRAQASQGTLVYGPTRYSTSTMSVLISAAQAGQ